MEKTIRQLLNDYNTEIFNKDILPDRATEILRDISSLYGNILDKIKDTEVLYNIVLLGFLDSEKKANRAKIKAEITKEYQDLQDAINAEKIALQTIRSLNRFIDSKKEEIRNSKYQ